jgi:hypothetical protein
MLQYDYDASPRVLQWREQKSRGQSPVAPVVEDGRKRRLNFKKSSFSSCGSDGSSRHESSSSSEAPRVDVIARLAPQSHGSKANGTASYHEGENLFRALFGQISINAKLREPWQRSPRRKKLENVGATLRHATEYSEPRAQHDARFGCSTRLGTRPAMKKRRTARGEGLMRIRVGDERGASR